MKATQDVREFARLQNQSSVSFVAADEAEGGMAEMSEVYDATERELYKGGWGPGAGLVSERGFGDIFIHSSLLL